jgi:molecular chaperone Hsp31 and glyoxalase 3
MPSEDEAVKGFFAKYHPQFKQPLKLSDVVARGLDDYIAIFVPGGHGALIGLPESKEASFTRSSASRADRAFTAFKFRCSARWGWKAR